MSGKKITEWTIVEDISSIKKIDIILEFIQKMSDKMDLLENKMDLLETKIVSLENKVELGFKSESDTKSNSIDSRINVSDDTSVERKLNTYWRKSYLTTTPNLGLKFILNNDTSNNNKSNMFYTNINKLD